MATTTHHYFFEDLSLSLTPESERSVKAMSRWAKVIGGLLFVVGVFACYHFLSATLVSVYMLGGLLIAGGIFYGISAFSARKWNVALLDVLACALYVIAGIVSFRQPIITASVVTLILSCLYLVQGVSRMIASASIRSPGWGWMFANGVVTLIFGAIVFSLWPGVSLWLLGTMVGIDMIMSGLAMIFGGMAVSRLRTA